MILCLEQGCRKDIKNGPRTFKHLKMLHLGWMCEVTSVTACITPALGDEGLFLHEDPKASDPEGVHGQLHSGREKPEADL